MNENKCKSYNIQINILEVYSIHLSIKLVTACLKTLFDVKMSTFDPVATSLKRDVTRGINECFLTFILLRGT